MAQQALPLEGEPPAQTAEQPPIQTEQTGRKKTGKKKTGKKKTGKKKAGKKTAKRAGKKTAKRAGKKTAKKASKKTSKKAASQQSDIKGCQAVTHILPIRELAMGEPVVEAWDGEKWVPINKPPPTPTAMLPASAAETSRTRSSARRRKAQAAAALGLGAAVVAGGIYLITRRKSATDPAKSPEVDTPGAVQGPVIDKPGAVQLPPPIVLGTIPPQYTRIYQLFDRFVQGGKEFFANVGDSESGNNLFAMNPAGVALSRAGVERQMQHAQYGQAWTGQGAVPYTAYLEPEKAKALPAMGLFQGVAGTIGQAGRRNGTAILAPRPVATWIEPAWQLAASMELFGALYHGYGATTPERMRIAWGLPNKATKPNDPYYVDRAAKFAARQKKTGVTSSSFGAVTLWEHSVEEVVAYFAQFDYSPVQNVTPRMAPMMAAPGPLSARVQARLQEQLETNPAFIGNDWSE